MVKNYKTKGRPRLPRLPKELTPWAISNIDAKGDLIVTKSISASVGKNGANKPNDVKIIQELLNRVPKIHGGPLSQLKVDGLCWKITLAAIGNFQKVGCGFQWPDQLIEPGGRTWNKLLILAKWATGVGIIASPPSFSTFQFFGVDSLLPADDDRYTPGKKFYDAVSNKLKIPITFWGRYIGASNPLSNHEINFLHKRNCKILVIYNGNSALSVRSSWPPKGMDNDAKKAIRAAGQIGVPVPKHVIIYANLDDKMNPSVDWISGWLREMYGWHGSAGVYMAMGSMFPIYCTALANVSRHIPDIKAKTSLMLGKGVTTLPPCHPSGFHIKQDTMNYVIFTVQGGPPHAAVDLDSAKTTSHMW